MTLDTVRKIASELVEMRNLETIYLNGYDEPTLNPNLANVVDLLSGIPATKVIFTNATNLNSQLVDDLIKTHAKIDIDIHLSSGDEQSFKAIHQSEQYERVMTNINALLNRPDIPNNWNIDVSAQIFDSIVSRTGLSTLRGYLGKSDRRPLSWRANDRAGQLPEPHKLGIANAKLGGCHLGNRASDWLHINSNGNVILCCQDYYEKDILGNLHDSSLLEIIESQVRQKYDDWVNGRSEAPADFICRTCVFASPRADEWMGNGDFVLTDK